MISRHYMTAAAACLCLFSLTSCPPEPRTAPKLRADAPQGWQTRFELADSNVTMKVLSPEKDGGDVGIGVIGRPSAKTEPEEAFKSLVAQIKEIGGKVTVGEFDRKRQYFSLTYTLETSVRSVGHAAVKTDSAGSGWTLIVSGHWPETRDGELAAVFAAFAASVDFK